MPTQTTPQRLRQIIDLIEAAKTMVELKTVLDTLTPEEHIDYEAWAQDLPGHIEPAPPIKPEPTPAPPQEQPEIKPTLIIARTPYPKWWKDTYAWNINIQTAGTHVVIPQTPAYRVYIATIVLTVSGETNITFEMVTFGLSGSMDFGGDNEPRGMVIAMGESPMPCGSGGFKIITDGAGIHVGGLMVYYYESGKET